MGKLRRVAMVSDIHGNTVALDAVLGDLAGLEPVDEVWALGDLVAVGPDPVGALERLTALRPLRCLAGNTERYVISGERALPDAEEAARRPHLPGLISGFAWTAGQLLAAGWLDWLCELPGRLTADVVGDRSLVGVHATPERDDGKGIHPGRTDAELDAMLVEADADILCAGHTHVALWRTTARGHVVNLGSVSNPPVGSDGRASYAVFDFTDGNVRVEHRQVSYDHGKVIDQLIAVRHPSVGFIEDSYFGRYLNAER